MQLLATASKLDWADWIRGVAGSFISGGAGAIGGGFGAIVADPENINIASGGVHKLLIVMGITFLFSAIISLAKFLQAHPVPDVVTTTQTAVTPTSVTTTTTSVTPPKP